MKFDMTVKVILWVALLLASPIVYSSEYRSAEDSKEYKDIEKKKLNPFVEFALIEGAFALNSALAAGDPKLFGVVGALLFPLADPGPGNRYTAGHWVGLVAVESLAIYNIVALDKKMDGENEIFRQNFIGWNIVAALVETTDYFSKKINKKSRYSFSVTPIEGGGFVQISKRF